MPTFASSLKYDVQQVLDEGVCAAAADLTRTEVRDGLVRVAPAAQPGDFQSSIALKLAREISRPPVEIAEELRLALVGLPAVQDVTVSGPGFVNFVIARDFLEQAVAGFASDPRLGIGEHIRHQRVVIDYSAPNVAKEMHVGHLRSTIIGDSLRRILLHLGHDVVAANHLGDWGTPFGMLIEHMLDSGADNEEISKLTEFYRDARARFDRDERFVERSRARVVKLQAGDSETLDQWLRLRAVSEDYFQQIYDALGVLLRREDNAGESFYNPMLAEVLDELQRKGLIEESDGALCIFPPGYQTREGDPMPIIVRKSDGGYNYDTTDLAALRYRLTELKATAVLYVVGAPQDLHFRMIFDAARMAGWVDADQVLRHVAFGSVLGKDGKMLKTRHGETVKLRDMLDEAIGRADQILEARGLDAEMREELAPAIGIGSVKYADLSTDRVRDYVFDIDRMVSFEGNTATYLQYARARAESIIDRAGGSPGADTRVMLVQPIERELALEMLRFGVSVNETAETLEPHRLCNYLFELASLFSRFYEQCPVAGAQPEVRASRLVLVTTFSTIMETALGLLGIQSPRRI